MNRFRLFLLFLLVVTTSLSAQDIVWPGDVNNNGIVNEADLLFLGPGFGERGPARKTSSAAWEQQDSPLPWATSAVPGLSSFLADCNGDGIIDSNDVEVIKANFGRTHNDVVFMPDEIPLAIAGINPAFSVPENTNLDVSPNTESITIPINLGDATLPVESLLGISFSVKVNGEAFDVSATKFELNGWLPNDSATIIKSEDLAAESRPENYIVAYTKTDKRSSSGNGLIGELTLTPGFILEDDVPNFRITIDSIILIDDELNKTPVVGTEIILNPVGFRDSTTVDTVICEGQSIVFNDSTLTTAGTYRDTLVNSVGGDSIIILNLAVLPTSELTINDTICQGDTYLFAGDTLSEVGTYIEFLAAANGCDSVTILRLEMRDTSQIVLDRSICQGDSFEFNAQALTEAGTYRDTVEGVNGCNQYVVLNLTVDDTSQIVIDRMICQGDLFAFNGQNLGTTGTYRDTLEGVNGCDQYIVLNLLVEDRFQTILTEAICQGEAYLFADVARVESGVYMQTLEAINGCDSVITLNLTVNDTIETIINQTICENSAYDFNGQALTEAGVYRDTQATINGCDSTIVLNLKVSDRYETERNEMICVGDSIIFNNQTIGTAGTYQEDFVAANGCDSIITLNLTVNSVGFTATSEEICFGSIRPFNGQDLTAAGTYLDTLSTVNGCDSIVELTLTVAPILESSSEQTICAGDTIEFYTFVLTETNSYTAVLKTAEGCDSMVILNLQVLEEIATTTEVSICAQDSFLFAGQILTEAGSYSQNFSSVDGCDSLAMLNLTILPAIKTGLEAVLCPQDTLQFGEQMLTEAGVYTESLTSINGCDSMVTLNLTMGIAGEGGCMSVSIEEEFLQSIEIYPNPVRQSLFINAPTVELNHIRLINITGQVLYEQAFNRGNSPSQQEVNMQDFVPGVYWVLIQTEYGLRQEKVVKF